MPSLTKLVLTGQLLYHTGRKEMHYSSYRNVIVTCKKLIYTQASLAYTIVKQSQTQIW